MTELIGRLFGLSGVVALVTGSSAGIGRGLAEAFDKLGNKVIVAGRRKANLADVVLANPGVEESAFFHQMNDWFSQG